MTVTDTLAPSYITSTSHTSGSAAEGAADRKRSKYAEISNTYTFVPIAFETLGPINNEGRALISDIGRRLTQVTGDKRETAFLYQRLAIAVQRFNAVAFSGSLPSHPKIDW